MIISVAFASTFSCYFLVSIIMIVYIYVVFESSSVFFANKCSICARSKLISPYVRKLPNAMHHNIDAAAAAVVV